MKCSLILWLKYCYYIFIYFMWIQQCLQQFWFFCAKKKTTRTSFVKLGIELANWRMKNCRVHIVTFARSTRYTRHTSQTHWKPRLRLTPSWTHCGDGEKWSKWGLNQGDSCAINGSICTPLDKNLSIELWEKFKATSREIMLSIFTTRWRRIN